MPDALQNVAIEAAQPASHPPIARQPLEIKRTGRIFDYPVLAISISVIILGFKVAIERASNWLEVAGGIVVILFGVVLFASALTRIIKHAMRIQFEAEGIRFIESARSTLVPWRTVQRLDPIGRHGVGIRLVRVEDLQVEKRSGFSLHGLWISFLVKISLLLVIVLSFRWSYAKYLFHDDDLEMMRDNRKRDGYEFTIYPFLHGLKPENFIGMARGYGFAPMNDAKGSCMEGTLKNGELWYHIDFENDVLYLRRAKCRDEPAVGEETSEGDVLLRSERTNQIIGLTVVSLWRRFGNGDSPDSLQEIAKRIEQLALRLAEQS